MGFEPLATGFWLTDRTVGMLQHPPPQLVMSNLEPRNPQNTLDRAALFATTPSALFEDSTTSRSVPGSSCQSPLFLQTFQVQLRYVSGCHVWDKTEVGDAASGQSPQLNPLPAGQRFMSLQHCRADHRVQYLAGSGNHRQSKSQLIKTAKQIGDWPVPPRRIT
jgi:hypothetical protein